VQKLFRQRATATLSKALKFKQIFSKCGHFQSPQS
jgi:hypothetical protein